MRHAAAEPHFTRWGGIWEGRQDKEPLSLQETAEQLGPSGLRPTPFPGLFSGHLRIHPRLPRLREIELGLR